MRRSTAHGNQDRPHDKPRIRRKTRVDMMNWSDELQYLVTGLMAAGITTIGLDFAAAGAALICYGIAGIVKDKQHTGKYFPGDTE
jgi:hypothetical protein